MPDPFRGPSLFSACQRQRLILNVGQELLDETSTMLGSIYDWLSEHIKEVGSVASVIGLGVTIWVAFSLRVLSKKAAFKGRLPDYVRDARKTSTELTSLLNSDEIDVDSAEITLRKSLSSVLSLKRKSPRELRKRVKSLKREIQKLTKAREKITRDAIRTVYNEVSSFEADLKNYEKDEKWRLE